MTLLTQICGFVFFYLLPTDKFLYTHPLKKGGFTINKTKKLTYSSILTAIGVVMGNIIFIPVGASKCFPIQHLINILAAVLLGPFYGVLIAFCISLIRNIMGTGTLLAFPGSMIGAFLAGMMYKYTKKDFLTVLAEIFGTGIIGAIIAYPIAAYVLGKKVAIFFYVAPFLISTIGGSFIAYILLKVLRNSKILNNFKGEK